MDETLHTERLLLRPVSPGDAPALFPIYHDPRAMRFMPSPPHRDAAETRVELTRDLGYRGACGWAICLKGSDDPVGYINFLGETQIPGMGYILRPDYWGRGIVPEAGSAALRYGFDQLGYDRVELWIHEDNAASIRVAQKLGFRLRGQIPQKYDHETVHHIMLVYGLAKGAEDFSGRFFRVEPVLKVPDVQKTAEYYRDILGFRIDFLYGSPPTHAGVSRGDWTGSGVTIQLSRLAGDLPQVTSSSLFILVGTGLDALFEAYRVQEVEMVSEPVTKPWGMRDFTIRDINGHLLTFATHV
jgi:RimJ/RimL family protein N-acetyltransferase/catechol 2,3-dioxygenase-like lactoylglutathione lyase family enzyme